jgi:FixJ family two-component response regulator
VTSFLEEQKVRAALDAGASGYLLKDATADDVADAVRVVAAGQVALQPSVTRTLIDAVRQPPPTVQLTPRERQVVLLVAEGRTGTDEPADREPSRGHRTHRADARVQHPGQTRPDLPHPSRDVGGQQRATEEQ